MKAELIAFPRTDKFFESSLQLDVARCKLTKMMVLVLLDGMYMWYVLLGLWEVDFVFPSSSPPPS
jgi:hypothetical protein